MYVIIALWDYINPEIMGIVDHRYKIIPMIKEYFDNMVKDEDINSVFFPDRDKLYNDFKEWLRYGLDEHEGIEFYDEEDNSIQLGQIQIVKVEKNKIVNKEVYSKLYS